MLLPIHFSSRAMVEYSFSEFNKNPNLWDDFDGIPE
jgi:hypothetical protein